LSSHETAKLMLPLKKGMRSRFSEGDVDSCAY
jgi:hypothetical protein